MANKKIVIEGIITPSIEGRDGLLTINGDLTITGTTTTVDTTNLNITDNIIVVNDGELGAGVTLGTAGIEIDRGSLSNAQFIFDDSSDEWTAKLADGTPILVVSGAVPTTGSHLTNKLYVDTTIATELAANIPTLLDDLTDTNVPTPTSGNSLVWSGTEWNDQLIPPGLSLLTINGTMEEISVSPIGAQSGITIFTVGLADIIPSGPATFSAANIAVDAKGRVTFAENGNIFDTISTSPPSASDILSSATSEIIVRGLGGIDASTALGTLDITLSTTGVSVGTFSIPTVTVDAQGRITTILAGSITKWGPIATNSGTVTPDNSNDTLTIVGGGGLTTSGTAGSDTITVTLPNTGVSAGTVGSSTLTPVITVNAQGRITALTTATNIKWTRFAADSGSTATANTSNDLFTFDGVDGIITTMSGDSVQISASALQSFSAFSMTQNGYVRFNQSTSGVNLVIQWGRTTVLTSKGTSTVFWPIAFTQIFTGVLSGGNFNNNTDDAEIGFQSLSNASGVILRGANHTSANWIVIGRI